MYIADCLSRQNHKENKDQEIEGIRLNIVCHQYEY